MNTANCNGNVHACSVFVLSYFSRERATATIKEDKDVGRRETGEEASGNPISDLPSTYPTRVLMVGTPLALIEKEAVWSVVDPS